ncbi:mucin-16-like isoform X2 [Palaemon carinicauda]
MGQSQAHIEEDDHRERAAYESLDEEEEEAEWSLNESGVKVIQVPANRETKDSPQKRSLHSTWSDIRKVSGESMSEYETMSGTTIKAPPLAERRSPLGASHSEGNISQRGPDLTDLDEDSGTKSHYCLHESYFFGSNNSIDSSISQPSCASLDSRLTHVSGSSNTYHSKLLPRNFFLDLTREGRGCASATSTPLTSPQSPSETRRHWDSSIWPEVERGLRRNQSVPDIRSAKSVDDKRHHRKGSLQTPRLLGMTSDDREKRQKIIEAVTQRLYPGSGPGFRRPTKKLTEKPQTAGERECSCRKKVGKIDPVITALKGSDNGTPRQTKCFSVRSPIPPRSQWDTTCSYQTSSLKSPPGSLLPIPIYGDSVLSEKSLSSSHHEISSSLIPQKMKKQGIRKDLKSNAPSLARMSNVTESKSLGNLSQNTNIIRMSDQAIGGEASSSDYDAGSNMEKQESKKDASVSRDDKDEFVKSFSPPENRLKRQAARSDPDLLSDVVAETGDVEGREGGETNVIAEKGKGEQERERRKIPLTPGLFQLQRALASLHDPEKFSDDSLELPTLDADSLSPSISRFSPPILDEDELSLGNISKDSLEDVTVAGMPFHYKTTSMKEKFASGLRPPLLKEKKDSFIEAFYNSVCLPDATDSLEIEEEYPSLTDDSSDIIIPESNKSSSYNSYTSPNLSSPRRSLPQKIVTATVPSSNTLSIPKGSRRSARERVEKRILDSTSSEDSDVDSRRRPRFRRRKGKRASLPIISMDTAELETRSDSTEYLSLRHSSPEKDVLLGSDQDNPLSATYMASKTKEVLPEEWGEDSISLYDNDSFIGQKRAKLRNFQIRYGKEIPEPPLPSERESPMFDFLPQECRVMQQADRRQVDMLPCNISNLETGNMKDVDTQVILKESARRLLQAVNKDGVMSEASQDAVADLLKASSQHLATYSLSIAADVNTSGIIRSDSVTTQDEEYDTAQGEETCHESSNDSQSSSKLYSSIQSHFSDNGAEPKNISPQAKKSQDEVAEMSGNGEKASFFGVISTGSGHDDAGLEAEDYMTSTTTGSDACSTEGSWEEMDMESYQKIQDSSLSKKHMQVIAAEFTPRTARRLLYTIVECSESSRSEGIPSESDIIPSDWQDTHSETGEEFASEQATDDISENLMSSSDETMLDTVRQNQEDPQDSLSCVSDDILGDSKFNVLDETIAGNSQLAKNLSGSLEFLTNLPMSPDIIEKGEEAALPYTPREKLQKEEFALSCDDDQNVSISSTQSSKDTIPDYIPSLDLSSVKDYQQSPIKRKDTESSRHRDDWSFNSNKKVKLQRSSSDGVLTQHSNNKLLASNTTRRASDSQNITNVSQHTESSLGKASDVIYKGQAISDIIQSPQKQIYTSVDGKDVNKPQTSLLNKASFSGITLVATQSSSEEGTPPHRIIPVTPQNSMADGITCQISDPESSQNLLADVISLQKITPLTPQNTLADGTCPRITTLTPQNSLADRRGQIITPLTPQNSLGDGISIQRIIPLTPQNSVVDSTGQIATPLTPQNSMAEGSSQIINTLTPQNVLEDGMPLQRIFPLTPQNSVTDRRDPISTPLTPQNSLIDALSFQEVTPLIPQNLLQLNNSLTPKALIEDGISRQKSIPLTPQNSVIEGSVIQSTAPELLQYLVANKMASQSIQEGQQQSVCEEHPLSKIMPITPQNSIVDRMTIEEGLSLTTQDSLVEGNVIIQNIPPPVSLQDLSKDKIPMQGIASDRDFGKGTVIQMIPQTTLPEGTAAQNIPSLTPQNSLVEGAAQNVTPEIFQNLLAYRFATQKALPQTSQQLERSNVSSFEHSPLTPQNSLVEGILVQNTKPENLKNVLLTGTDGHIFQETSQDKIGTSCINIENENLQVSAAEKIAFQSKSPSTEQDLIDEKSAIQDIAHQMCESAEISFPRGIDISRQFSEEFVTRGNKTQIIPQNSSVDISATHQMPPPTPQNSLSEGNVDNVISTKTQCLMEEADANESISSLTSHATLMVDASCADNLTSQHSSSVAVGGVPQVTTPLNSSSGAVNRPICESTINFIEGDVDIPPAIFQDGRSVTKNVLSSTVSSQESAANLMAHNSLARDSPSEIAVTFTSQNSSSLGNTNSVGTPVIPSQCSLLGTITSQELPVISSQNSSVEISPAVDMNLSQKCMQEVVHSLQVPLTTPKSSTFSESSSHTSFPDASFHEDSVLSPSASLGEPRTSQGTSLVSPMSNENYTTQISKEKSNMSQVYSAPLSQSLSSTTDDFKMASLSSDIPADLSCTSEILPESLTQTSLSDAITSQASPSLSNQSSNDENTSQKRDDDINTSNFLPNSLSKIPSGESEASEKLPVAPGPCQIGSLGNDEINTVLSKQIKHPIPESSSQLASMKKPDITQSKSTISQEAPVQSSQLSPDHIGANRAPNASEIPPMADIHKFHSTGTIQTSTLPTSCQSGKLSDQHSPQRIPTVRETPTKNSMVSSDNNESFEDAAATDSNALQKNRGLHSSISSTLGNSEPDYTEATKQTSSSQYLSHQKNISLQDNEHEKQNIMNTTVNKILSTSESIPSISNESLISGNTNKHSNYKISENTKKLTMKDETFSSMKPLSTMDSESPEKTVDALKYPSNVMPVNMGKMESLKDEFTSSLGKYESTGDTAISHKQQQQQNLTHSTSLNNASQDNASGTESLPHTSDISSGVSTIQKGPETHFASDEFAMQKGRAGDVIPKSTKFTGESQMKIDSSNILEENDLLDKEQVSKEESSIIDITLPIIKNVSLQPSLSDTEDAKTKIQKYNLPKIEVEQSYSNETTHTTAASSEALPACASKDQFIKVHSPEKVMKQDESELQIRTTETTGEIPGSQSKDISKGPSKPIVKKENSIKDSAVSLSPVLPSGSPFHQQSNKEYSTDLGYKRIVRQISSFEENDPREEVSNNSAMHLKVSDHQTQEYEEGKLSSIVKPHVQDENKQVLDETAQVSTGKPKKNDNSSASTSESPRSITESQPLQQQDSSSVLKKFEDISKMDSTKQGNLSSSKSDNKVLPKKLFQSSNLQSPKDIKNKLDIKLPKIPDPSSKSAPKKIDISAGETDVRVQSDSSNDSQISSMLNERAMNLQQSTKNDKETASIQGTKDFRDSCSRDLGSAPLLSRVAEDKNKKPQSHKNKEASVEVTISDYSEPCSLGEEDTPEQIKDKRSSRGLSQLSPRGKEKQIEKLTSSTWQGTFVMEHEHSEDDWGASDESITFIFMTPREEERNPQEGTAIQDSYGTTGCSNYRSSSDLSQIGLNADMSHESQYIHPYDLYKTNCRRLIRTTSLDSISSALQKLRQTKIKAEMQRTCSLEDMTIEMAAILERGRMFSVESGIEISSDMEATLLSDHELKPTCNEIERSAGSHDNNKNNSHKTSTTDSSNQQKGSQSSFEDDVFTKSPSPILTYGQVSMGDWKSLILGRSVSPSSKWRVEGETSKSSPQLHQRSSENLNKKSVSWTDLQGCGALEIEVTELDEVKEMSIKPIYHVKSIMKKPSLAPIAPTPPPATPTISSPDCPPSDVLPQQHTESLPTDISDDDVPLPRSNLKEMFSLQLPPHIKDRAFRTSSPLSENQHIPFVPGSPSRQTSYVNDQQNLKPSRISNITELEAVEYTLPIPADPRNISFNNTQANHSTADTRNYLNMPSQNPIYNYSSYDATKPAKHEYKSTERLSSSSSAYSTTESYTLTTASQGNISSGVSSQGTSPVFDNASHDVSRLDRIQRHHSSQITPSSQSGTSIQIPSPTGTASAPTTPGENISSSLISPNNGYMPRYKSEGDLTVNSEGLSSTWVTLSRVMQEAGTILKTLSETSLVLHNQIAGPDQRGSLPPVLEENSTFVDNRKVSSVAVQTDKSHRTRTNIRSTIAQTSFESSSDTENVDGSVRQTSFPSRLLSHKSSYRKHGSDNVSSENRGMSVLKELNRLRRERERMNSVMSQYDSHTFSMPFSKNRPGHKSYSSDLDSSLTNIHNITTQPPYHGREISSERHSYHQLSATSQHYLAMYHRRLQESCHHLEERLRLSAKKRKLRSRLLSNSHSHFHTDPAKMALHASLDFAKNTFCGRPDSTNSTPYMSTASLPSIGPPQSPIQTGRDVSPCCCISPTHQSHHNHLCSPTRTCSAHTHWASCHTAPTSDITYTPQCFNDRIRTSSQQCRDQLLHLRKQLVSTPGLASSSSSLGDASPPGRGNSHNLRGMRNMFDTPYQRDQAASLSSLPLTSNHRGWRHNITGSTASVASEGEADRLRWPRHRLDSDSDSGAGWSSSGTSLRHTCY